VQYAAYLIGKYPTKDYILLGDDIVIGGDQLAASYRDIMTQLGVGISSHKSHVSKDTYEFAKRWFRGGKEISGIQIQAFLSTRLNWSLLYQTFQTYLERGFHVRGFVTLPDLLVDFLKSTGVYPRLAENIGRKVSRHHAVYRWIHNGDRQLLRTTIVQSYPYEAPIPDAEHPAFDHFVNMRMGISYQKLYDSLQLLLSNYIEEVDKALSPLYDFIGDTVDLTSYDLDQIQDSDFQDCGIGPGYITSHPIAISLRNEFEKLSQNPAITNPQRDYHEAVKALCIPLPSAIAKSRKSHQIMFIQSKLAMKLFEVHRTLFRNNGPGWMFEAQYWTNQ